MSFEDSHRLRARASSAAIVLKLLQAATTWLRCRNFLVAKRTDDARAELVRLHAALSELDGELMNEEHTKELDVLRQEAVRLDAKLRGRDDSGLEDS